MPIAEVNGQRIHYTDSGGDGPLVLCSHGFLMGHEMWDPQVGALRDAYRVVAYDERGWGQTTFTHPFTYWDMADDAIALLGHLGAEQAVLMGMSQGGFLSLRAALRAPDRVRALVLVDTESAAQSAEDREAFTGLFEMILADGWTAEHRGIVASILFGPEFDSTYWQGKWMARPPAAVQPAMDNLMGRDDITDRIPEITCPALVVHGEVDAAIPIDRGGEALAAALPAAEQLVRVPGAGHTANLEDPAVVSPAIRAFLDGLT